MARIRGCTSSYIELDKGQQPRYTGANSRPLAEEGTVLAIAWREHYLGSSRNAQEYFFLKRKTSMCSDGQIEPSSLQQGNAVMKVREVI